MNDVREWIMLSRGEHPRQGHGLSNDHLWVSAKRSELLVLRLHAFPGDDRLQHYCFGGLFEYTNQPSFSSSAKILLMMVLR